ncbi:MAG: hypothetical protein AVDCRST_MAG64-2838, partial [uncultured Phycisphaerae bacterium]
VYRLRRCHPPGHRRQRFFGRRRPRPLRADPPRHGQGGRAGIVADHAGRPQDGRGGRTAARPRRRAADRDGRRDRPRPVLRRGHRHPPACTRLFAAVRLGNRVLPAGRGHAG